MTDNKPVIGETTHILNDDAKIKTLESVIRNYEDREQATQAQIVAIKTSLGNFMEANAQLKDTIDFWRGATVAALILAASSVAALIGCLMGVIG